MTASPDRIWRPKADEEFPSGVTTTSNLPAAANPSATFRPPSKQTKSARFGPIFQQLARRVQLQAAFA